jgi:hypothetical protein
MIPRGKPALHLAVYKGLTDANHEALQAHLIASRSWDAIRHIYDYKKQSPERI